MPKDFDVALLFFRTPKSKVPIAVPDGGGLAARRFGMLCFPATGRSHRSTGCWPYVGENPPGGGVLAPSVRCLDKVSILLIAENCCSWRWLSSPVSYSRRVFVVDRSKVPLAPGMVGVIGVCPPLRDGVLWEVKEVAAVELRVIEGPPEEVVEEVSLFRLYPERGGELGRDDSASSSR